MVDIEDNGRHEPVLLALAATGYAGYVLLGWLSWLCVRRFERSLGRVLLLASYMTAMAGVYLAATVLYLMIERLYLWG
jgi:hypothetical protein